MKFVRNVEVWIFAAFGALVLAACLDGPAERSAPAFAGVRQEVDLAQPAVDAMQPMYIVYVVGKRPSAAEKRALRASAG